MTNPKNLICDKTQKLKLWQNSKSLTMTKIKTWQNLKNQIVMVVIVTVVTVVTVVVRVTSSCKNNSKLDTSTSVWCFFIFLGSSGPVLAGQRKERSETYKFIWIVLILILILIFIMMLILREFSKIRWIIHKIRENTILPLRTIDPRRFLNIDVSDKQLKII